VCTKVIGIKFFVVVGGRGAGDVEDEGDPARK
jgi:hypothetical protein